MPAHVRCPICQKECTWRGNPHRPFCSERCRLIDLSNWLGERYRIPGAPAGDQSESDSDQQASAPRAPGKHDSPKRTD
ncbi:MAG: DNA gyrase inhibitor YacG [Deltaproteobacteria bacterium]|nr:DNA gyrase inhibitor YacG [Deltaproteobacteria bacterium]